MLCINVVHKISESQNSWNDTLKADYYSFFKSEVEFLRFYFFWSVHYWPAHSNWPFKETEATVEFFFFWCTIDILNLFTFLIRSFRKSQTSVF